MISALACCSNSNHIYLSYKTSNGVVSQYACSNNRLNSFFGVYTTPPSYERNVVVSNFCIPISEIPFVSSVNKHPDYGLSGTSLYLGSHFFSSFIELREKLNKYINENVLGVSFPIQKDSVSKTYKGSITYNLTADDILSHISPLLVETYNISCCECEHATI